MKYYTKGLIMTYILMSFSISSANPFLAASQKQPVPKSPAEQSRESEFESIYGKYPSRMDFPMDRDGYMQYRAATVEWRQNKRLFIGLLPNSDVEKYDLLVEIYNAWNMSIPVFYSINDIGGRTYEKAAFPAVNYRTSYMLATEYPHLAIAQYQIHSIRKTGELPEVCHPFVPPHICQDLKDKEE